jgi:predicted GTPase
MAGKARRRIVIVGAAGRDFHNFNVVYRDDPTSEVVAFTGAQIPGITDRRYPPALAGPHYSDGIPIEPESELDAICREHNVDEVVFAYSDVPHELVMHIAARALACGADFRLLGPAETMLVPTKPVIAVSAVRTGCGKSQTARWLTGHLRAQEMRVAAIRHPMPYGDLSAMAVQRFASVEDLDAANCTIEEREEYEPHVASGAIVYAGVDYETILRRAEAEADILVWDGGNNDFPFVRPTLHLVVMDALRPGQAAKYHPGEAVARMADVIIVNKVDAAEPADVDAIMREADALNPHARVIRAASPVRLDDPAAVRGKRCLVVEDGPTLTHGGMRIGAGYAAATAAGAIIVDPRASATPGVSALYDAYPHIGPVLPAIGYDAGQVADLAGTINASGAEVVVAGTPIDLAALAAIDRPVVRARYDYADAGQPTLAQVVAGFLRSLSTP